MNWVDIVLLVLLIAAVIVGSKKGLIRELVALIVLTATVIVTVNYIDVIAFKVYEQLGGSPLITAMLSFIILLGIVYLVFKLLGLLFYKVVQLQKLGKKDQLGGAIIGAVRGWVMISMLVFLVFLVPLPDRFYADFDDSFLGPTFAKSLPIIYESSTILHPKNPSFIKKVEKTLLEMPTGNLSRKEKEELSKSRVQVHEVHRQIDRFFDTKN